MTQEEVFKIFGHISVFYATLDFFVTVYIFDIVNNTYKNNNKPLTDKMTLGNKLNFIKNLKDQDVTSILSIGKTRAFIDEAIAVSKERNRFIHDQWLFDPNHLNQNKISRSSIVNVDNWKLDMKHSKFYSKNDLEDLIARLGELQEKFYEAKDLII